MEFSELELKFLYRLIMNALPDVERDIRHKTELVERGYDKRDIDINLAIAQARLESLKSCSSKIAAEIAMRRMNSDNPQFRE